MRSHIVYRLIIAGILFLCTESCRFNPDMQSEGASFLQGVWVQNSIPMQDALLQYTLHEFKFTCDSIYAVMHTTATVKNVADSCYHNGHWTEYAKGVYVVRGDSLRSEEHTSELQSREKLVCRHLLEKKKNVL